MRQRGDAAADRLADIDRVAQAPAAHHVAALLVIGVGVEQVVGHILQDFLEPRAGHRHAVDLRIADRGDVVDVLDRDRPGQHARAPAEAGRERDLGVAFLDDRRADEVVEGAVDGAAAIEQRLRAADDARQLAGKRRARLRDRGLDRRIGADANRTAGSACSENP